MGVGRSPVAQPGRNMATVRFGLRRKGQPIRCVGLAGDVSLYETKVSPDNLSPCKMGAIEPLNATLGGLIRSSVSVGLPILKALFETRIPRLEFL